MTLSRRVLIVKQDTAHYFRIGYDKKSSHI